MDAHVDARWERGLWIGTIDDGGGEHRGQSLEQLLLSVEEHFDGSDSDLTINLTVRNRPDPDWPTGSNGVSWGDAMRVFEDTPLDEASWIRAIEEERARPSNVLDDPWQQHRAPIAPDHDNVERTRDFRYVQTSEEAQDDSSGVKTGDASADEPIYLWAERLRPAPDGWVHVTTSAHAILVLRTGRVVELSFDHDLSRNETTIPVVDWMAEHGIWPAIVRVRTGEQPGRDRQRWTTIRYQPSDGYRGL
ncbi:hypothetical protein GS896_25735 [Rhodococcus hoagii]|nr:hypothetical protein [Prescottella equi]MBM4654092.1 hypothetical protein [Prescottella equi]MBM4719566.1 hypothetical protein [Prescottella equi]NKR23365.1 hypothetical protein [Prescottella equi]NKT56024.1 hypothetical protein [Prescottella equi]